MKRTFVFILAVAALGLTSCGSNNDCPTGVNTTHSQCPNYNPNYYQQPNTQYPQQYPNQYPGQYPNQYPTQYQYPNQYPNQYPSQYGYPCQAGTPNCVNGQYYPPTTR